MSDTISETQDRILTLAEMLDGIQEQLVLLEKQADAAKVPIEAAKTTQETAIAALNAAVEGLNAPKLDGFRAEIRAAKDEIRAAIAEAGAELRALREHQNAIKREMEALRADNYKQFSELSQEKIEFSSASAARHQELTAELARSEQKAEQIEANLSRRIAEVEARPSVTPEQVAEAVSAVKSELLAKFEAAKQEVVASPGLNPRGKYDEKQQYARMDIVESNGSSFIALTDGKKERPRKGKPNIGWMVCAAGAGGVGGSADAVLYTAQTLTNDQKAQARSNIGVAGGTGDLVAANNLSDVASVATAFANIKQAATTSATGVVELATDGETGAGKVVQGNDSRLSDSRTPTAHVHSGDALTPASLAAAGTVTGSNLSGTNTGDQTTVTGNAGTATKLATARAINGIDFDGTAPITITAAPTAHVHSGDALTPASLAAVGAVTGSNLSGTNTGDNAVNSLYSPLVTNATHTGDATGSGALTLATVNANVGSFGSATAASTFTVNAKGLITAAGSTTVTPAVGSITGLGTGVGAALAINVGSAGAPVTFNGALGTPSSGTLTNCTGLPTAGIVDAAVTLAKLANLAQDQFIVRTTASTGVPQTATVTAAARTVLDDATVSAMLDTLGGTSATGTGGVVRATSPTLVTPALGTPSSGTLTSCTVKVEFGFACSDETTALTTGEKVAFYAPFAFTLTGVYACVTTAPTGSALTVDVEKPAGTSLLSAVASISASGFNASGTVSGGTQSISQGDRVSIDIDQIGSTIAGAGLKVFLTGTRT
jgi:hypothetical protein